MLGEGGSRGRCPGGASFALPAHAKESAALQRQLLCSGAPACWLPLQGALPGSSKELSVQILYTQFWDACRSPAAMLIKC